MVGIQEDQSQSTNVMQRSKDMSSPSSKGIQGNDERSIEDNEYVYERHRLARHEIHFDMETDSDGRSAPRLVRRSVKILTIRTEIA